MKMEKLRSSTHGLTKTHPIKKGKSNFKKKNSENKVRLTLGEQLYLVPLTLVKKLEIELKEHLVKEDSFEKKGFNKEEFFKGLRKQKAEWAINLRGLRYREGLTQIDFAKKLNLSQSNLSAMENGRRAIGKEIAKRIEKKFKIDYRLFL